MGAEVNHEVLLKYISTNYITNTIIKMILAKLKALKHGLMELLLAGWLAGWLAGYSGFTMYQTKSSSTLWQNSIEAFKV